MAVDLLVCFSTELEGSLLREAYSNAASIALVRTGVGPVNAAHAVTLFVARETPGAILLCGVGGAYPGSGLAIGEVVCAASECYGDLGATSPAGFLDMQALGFPVVEGPPPLYNTLPMQLFPAPKRVPFVTLTSCTGTDDAACATQARTGGAVESMEGAAVAHIAHLHGIPVGEIRGISNMVGNRNPAAWRLREAAAVAQEALISWIAAR
ncbi:MAG TPA: futalosine hydrolase [Vicinamibacterales bacterium]|nr:futalosine hydrolase [Vicinamibacterales bacterium]